MKIGILTLPLHTNYGGILQAYALQTVLQQLGHEVFVIDQDKELNKSFLQQILSFGKYCAKRFLLGKNERFHSRREQRKSFLEQKERERYTRDFINKHINILLVKNLTKDVPKNLDAIVVGSDQIWRHGYFTGAYHCGIENAFLKFLKNSSTKRIAYAASFGTDEWEYSKRETFECSKLLKKFIAVSVREKSAVSLCKDMLGFPNVTHTLDPTMLLEKEKYIRLVEQTRTPKSPGNLLCYILDHTDEKQWLVEKIAQDRKLKPFNVNSKIEDPSAPQQERIQPPLEQWLRGFMDAEFVVTDSFHACVFSIIFGKPFVVVGNKKRGMARFESLLSLFVLEKNLIYDTNKYDSTFTYCVNTKAQFVLAEMTKMSFLFLSHSLK